MAQGTSKSGHSNARSGSSRSGSRANSSSAKSRSKATSNSGRSQSSRSAGGARRSAGESRTTSPSGAQSVGHAVGTAAGRAKGPAIAGGAALAGLVGGMAIASRGGRRRVLGMPVPGTKRPLISVRRPARMNTTRKLVKAAGHMGNAGLQMAELASEMRLAREQLGANARRRSPVEVVLDGLTTRRSR
jgi:hypothetical protein